MDTSDLSDLLRSKPTATSADPFCEVRWLFEILRALEKSAAAKEHVGTARNWFVRSVEALGHTGPYKLKRHINTFTLFNFYTFVKTEFDGSPLTLTGYVTSVRKALRTAVAYEIVPPLEFAEVSISGRFKTTDQFDAYTAHQIHQIREVLRPHLHASRDIANFRPPNVGTDPRTATVNSGALEVLGWTSPENCLWFYNNVITMQPLGSGTSSEEIREFRAQVTRHFGNPETFLKTMGVPLEASIRTLVPVMVYLHDLTGLNPACMQGLPLRPLIRHPLTSVDLLLYYKSKTGSEKELPVPLLNGHAAKIDELILCSEKQTTDAAARISRAIELVQRLTHHLRHELPDGHALKEKLFIFRKSSGDIAAFTNEEVQRWFRTFKADPRLVNEDGTSFSVNAARFRPAVITSLVESGMDIVDVADVTGHADSLTLKGYVADNAFDINTSRKVKFYLQQIFENKREYEEHAAQADQNGTEVPHIFKGILSDCKNVFNPPENIRKAVDFKNGQSCPRMNMCIHCGNVVVFPHHLPILANYRLQIKARLDDNVNIPNEHLYRQQLDVIDALLDPERSEFTPEQIQYALDHAYEYDEMIDPTVFKSVDE
jgi:hypothetical protein